MEKQTLFFSLLVFPSQLWSGFEVFSITSHSNNEIWVRFSFLHPFSPPKPLFLCLTIHIVLLVFFSFRYSVSMAFLGFQVKGTWMKIHFFG